ncbi:MAG: hypothetical protein HOV82_16795 [Streptomyces sp.]|nr:hypothetical protein [Streptomyces sp.]NUP36167.1 hypothetical protein [Streptomyces sp.]NUS75514.1 hypothetical protein [Streptomyces sp.]
MTDPTTPARRAGLRDEIAAALEAADYRMDMRRGDLADAVLPVLYREWPWLRAEAEDAAVPPVDRAATLSDAERTMLAYALDQAQEHIWSRDGFTDEDQAAVTSLRRLATATTEAEPVSCAHCGNTIRRITGTLTAWWVHTPGGQAMCQPWQPARSTRATPKPAAGARQDGAPQ